MPDSKLTDKQRAFVDAYLGPSGYNATDAAKRAGYSERTAYSQGSRMLKDVEVKQAIAEHFERLAMGPEEVLSRLANMARASMDDFVELVGDGDWKPSLKKARAAGKMGFIKKIGKNRQGQPEIELYDAQKALQLIGQHHRLFAERTEHTGLNGGPIEVTDVISDDERATRIAAILQRRREEGNRPAADGEKPAVVPAAGTADESADKSG